MKSRGVTRPMAEQEQEQEQDTGHAGGHGKDHEQHEGGEHEMSHDDRRQMLQAHHQQTLWVYWTLPLLGLWLLVSPTTLGYLAEDAWVDPSGGRGPWFTGEPTDQLRHLRAWLTTWSDVLSGAVLLVFGWRALTPNRPVSLWICCFVGIWLTFAPTLLWAPTAAAYINDSLVGILVIALTVLIPGMPNMTMFMQHGPATPPGWSYNPSSWPQRWIMIAAGFVGFIVSRYLAMYQLGYIDYVYDPFFGFEQGTQKVLDSEMSHMWPISDAGLGTISYTFEFLMGYMGSPSRWRTMPWMVAFFGILVIPLGLTHIILVISQPLLVHQWCTLCLVAAAIMLPMIPLEADEVVAMLQHVKQAKRRGDRGGSLWAIFWKGGRADGCTPDERSPALVELPNAPQHVLHSAVWGMSVPWSLLASTVAGVVLMFLPTWYGIDIREAAADVAHLGGALTVTIAVIAMGEVVRIGRYLNIVTGVAVAALPWLVDAPIGYNAACAAIGLAISALALPRGPKRETYGTWDAYVR